MTPLTPAGQIWRRLKYWGWALQDAFPPYRLVEGSLDSKDTANGKTYLCVASAKVEVDKDTFDVLVLGEDLRVRYTRGNRAINIDRLVSGNGQG